MYWLSESFHTLFESSQLSTTSQNAGRKTSADIVVIGSGYGGAIAVQKLAQHLKKKGIDTGKAKRIIVLERGQEFLPGEFPEDIGELPSQIRINGNVSDAQLGYPSSLFQVFPSDSENDSNISVLVGSALGGGSQINANVAKRPLRSVFSDPRWPKEFHGANSSVLDPHFDAVLSGLEAKPLPDSHSPKKLKALERLHTQLLQPEALPEGFDAVMERPPITVNFTRFKGGLNNAEVDQPECILCGNCCTGCNTGAKNTLTTNYLPRAKRDGAELYTEAMVDQIHWDEATKLFEVAVRSIHSLDAPDQLKPLNIVAKVVILAGGALGSTEILLRSRSLRTRISKALGKGFSTNGDSISARYNTHFPVQGLGLGLAAKDLPVEERPGPTITGAIQIVPSPALNAIGERPPASFTIEDCAIPSGVSELGAELVTTSAMFRQMTKGLKSSSRDANIDPLANDAAAIARSEFYLAMTRDSASGQIILTAPTRQGSLGHAKIQWTNERAAPFEAPQNSHEQRLLDQILAHPEQLGGTYLPNPLREPVPASIGSMMRNAPGGSAVTVHPLGGCPMADSADRGVVDYRGRVFDRSNGRVIPGLYVMDGSIVPCALETNPFLTISAITEHAVEKLIELDLEQLLTQPNLGPSPSTNNAHRLAEQAQHAVTSEQSRPMLLARPSVIRPSTKVASPSFEFKERLRAKLSELQGLDGLFNTDSITPEALQQGLVYLELQLSYRPQNLKDFLAQAKHQCDLQGQLRLIRRRLSFPAFTEDDWEQIGEQVTLESGTIQLFVQTSKPSKGNALRAGLIYLERRFFRERGLEGGHSPRRTHLPSLLSFLGHVGATREVRYDYSVRSRSGELIRGQGCKPIRYRRDSNVWKDLFSLPMSLEGADKLIWEGKLIVDVDYFLMEGVPSVRDQKNLPESLLQIANYGMFYLRVILSTYFYEFGPPDYPSNALQATTLSGPLEVLGQLHRPQHYWLPVAEFGQTLIKEPVPGQKYRDLGLQFERKLLELQARTHAPSEPSSSLVSVYETKSDRPKGSVLLLHGYAISSSMWSSPRIGQNMVQSLLDANFDVYVADLRTSSSLGDLINHAVSFDQVAAEDIPCLIEFVWQKNRARVSLSESGTAKIHIVAHCMGSAQFSMALLAQAHKSNPGGAWSSGKARFELSKNRIAKASFFQVAPLMAVTRANSVRGRAAGVLDALVRQQQVGPWLAQASRVKPLESLLDRLAMSFPYPDGFDTAEPDPREASPWVGVTRKAFWLYGQTWDNANLNDEVKRNIHEIIGPVNLATYRQVGAFTRSGRVVNREGSNDYVKDRYLEEVFSSFESLWLHGERSGMFEKQTTEGTSLYLKRLLEPRGLEDTVRFQSLPGFGHLDSLIGEHAHLHAHQHVINFLQAPPVSAKPLEIRRIDHLQDTEQSIKPVTCGPFFTRTADQFIRVWFFIEEQLSDQFSHACIGLVSRLQTGADRQDWSLHKAWRVYARDQLAGLRQFVFEFPEQELLADMRVVVGGVFELNQSLKSKVQPDLDFALFKECLHALIEHGSFVAPPSLPLHGTSLRSFLVGSCQYPGWLIDRAHAKAAHSEWRHFVETQSPVPEALVLTGDQVYLDAFGNVIADAPRSDTLCRIYTEAFGGKTNEGSEWSKLLRRLSLHCQMDDHEFTDNYTLSSGLSESAQVQALHAFTLFQGPSLPSYRHLLAHRDAHRLELGKAKGSPKTSVETLSGATTLCGHSAFMLDTRSQRSRQENRLYSDQDFQAFKLWAAKADKSETKFLFTGSVLFPVLRNNLAQPASGFDEDTLSAYPEHRNRLLEVLAAERLSNVIFVSGDLHLSCSGRGVIHTDREHLPFGFCVSSGLYNPLPFANTRSWELPQQGLEHRLTFADRQIQAIDFRIEHITEEQCLAQIVFINDANAKHTQCTFVDAQGLTGPMVSLASQNLQA